jgi:hypothetical protein
MKIAKYILLVALTILLLGVICFAAILTLFVYACDWFPYNTLASIDVGNGRTVSIYESTCWEYSRNVYYTAQERGTVIVPPMYWEEGDGSEQYNLKFVSIENGSLVGVFDPSKPTDRFFIIIDFRTGESWPRFIGDYGAYMAKRDYFFNQLQKEHPNHKVPTSLPTLPPPPTVLLPTPAEPTPTSTLVVQPTYYNTPGASSDNSLP